VIFKKGNTKKIGLFNGTYLNLFNKIHRLAILQCQHNILVGETSRLDGPKMIAQTNNKTN
jgi:hypothetical protein